MSENEKRQRWAFQARFRLLSLPPNTSFGVAVIRLQIQYWGHTAAAKGQAPCVLLFAGESTTSPL